MAHGVLALADGSIGFYMVKAYRSSPFEWHVGAIGFGRVPPGSVDGVRATGRIWDDDAFASRIAGVRCPCRSATTCTSISTRSPAKSTWRARHRRSWSTRRRMRTGTAQRCS